MHQLILYKTDFLSWMMDSKKEQTLKDLTLDQYAQPTHEEPPKPMDKIGS